MELIGIFVGHLYFFLMFKYPQDFGGQRFLSTPSILYVVWLILHCTFSIVHFPLYIFHCTFSIVHFPLYISIALLAYFFTLNDHMEALLLDRYFYTKYFTFSSDSVVS